MRPWKRLRQPTVSPEAGIKEDRQHIESLVPEDREVIVADAVKGLGITMLAGTILDAVRGVACAGIVQHEHPDSPEYIELAGSVIESWKKDLAQSRAALEETGGDREAAAELNITRIRQIVDQAYSQETQPQADPAAEAGNEADFRTTYSGTVGF